MCYVHILKLLFLKLGEVVHLTALAVQAHGKSLQGLSLVDSSSSQASNHQHHHLSNLHSNSFLFHKAINLLNNPHPSLCNLTNSKVM
jgi:hypothetical protein